MKIVSDFKAPIDVPAEGACAGEGDCDLVRPEMSDRVESVLITRRLVERRVRALAAEISAFYRGERRLELVFILEGARTFATDLEKAVYDAGGPEVRSQSIKARTYGAEIKREGETGREVRIYHEPTGLEGKRVLLVEDIVDQGFTLHAVRDWLLEDAGAAEVRVCVLLEKKLMNPTPEVRRLRQSLKPDWVGFRVPDRWVAGYGVDAGEDFRNLPFVVVVREERYLKKA